MRASFGKGMSPNMLALSLLTFSDLLLMMPPLATQALSSKAVMEKINNRKV